MTDTTHAYHTPPGVEVILASVLTCATGVDNYLPCGITVLTEAVLDRVLRAGRSLQRTHQSAFLQSAVAADNTYPFRKA